MPTPSIVSGCRFVLLALAASVAASTSGCHTSGVITEPAPTTASPNIEIRLLVVQGLPESPAFGLRPGPANHSVEPDWRKQIRCRVLSKASMNTTLSAVQTQGLTVLGAPYILAGSGQSASVECASDPGVAMKIDVTATSMSDGTLRLKLAYRERDGGYEFPETEFTLGSGESAVAIVQTQGYNGEIRTLFVTPTPVASR